MVLLKAGRETHLMRDPLGICDVVFAGIVPPKSIHSDLLQREILTTLSEIVAQVVPQLCTEAFAGDENAADIRPKDADAHTDMRRYHYRHMRTRNQIPPPPPPNPALRSRGRFCTARAQLPIVS